MLLHTYINVSKHKIQCHFWRKNCEYDKPLASLAIKNWKWNINTQNKKEKGILTWAKEIKG